MKNAVEKTVEENGSTDITAIFGGSCQRHGHPSTKMFTLGKVL